MHSKYFVGGELLRFTLAHALIKIDYSTSVGDHAT